MNTLFPNTIASLGELRLLYREPSPLVQSKKMTHLDEVSTRFIIGSPFLLLGTSSLRGPVEVSPRGGSPGWVKVLDNTHLLIPDLSGNNLIDSMTNILENPYVGVLFVHPGKDETLRVNGKAWITIDSQLLEMCTENTTDGRTPKIPKAALGIEITDVFIHCAKAFRRGNVWNPSSWPTLDKLDAVDILRSQLAIQTPKHELLSNFAQGYDEDLQADFQPQEEATQHAHFTQVDAPET
jgi:uncharacterized protein